MRYAVSVTRSLVGKLVAFHDNVIFSYSHCYEVTRYAVSVMRSLAGIIVAFHNNLILSYSHILIVMRLRVMRYALCVPSRVYSLRFIII